MRFTYLLLFLIFTNWLPGQEVLERIIQENRADLGAWAEDPDKYEIQVLYSEIERRPDGSVRLTTHRWGSDSTRYFHPASTVKMPTAVA